MGVHRRVPLPIPVASRFKLVLFTSRPFAFIRGSRFYLAASPYSTGHCPLPVSCLPICVHLRPSVVQKPALFFAVPVLQLTKD
jgi:hypothetical protein